MNKALTNQAKSAAVVGVVFIIVLLLLWAGDEYDIPLLKQAYDVLD